MSRDIDIAKSCDACGAAEAVVIYDRTLSDDGDEVLAIWRETLPAHDCERMRRLTRELWPASAL